MRRHRLVAVLSSVAIGVTLSVVPLPTVLGPVAPAGATVATSAGSLAEYELHDTFDGATDNGPHYGLNTRLAQRQLGSASPVGYTRRSGYVTGSAGLSSVQVNHPSFAGKLSFHQPSGQTIPTTAVRLDAPVVPSAQGLRARASVSPLLADDSGAAQHAWTSLMLTQSATSNGYVTASDIELGVLVRSSGRVEIYERGTALVPYQPSGISTAYVDLTRAATYDVEVRLASTVAVVTVNGVEIRAGVTAQSDRRHYVMLGNYFDPAITGTTVSTVDDLEVWRVATVQHYGHYWTRYLDKSSTPWVERDHLPEVDVATNFNFVQHADELPGCGFRECVLEARWQFFPDETRRLDPGYQTNWDGLVADIGTNHDRIAAFYIIDEPYNGDAHLPTRSELDTSIATIRESYPNIPIMATFAGAILFPDSSCGANKVVLDCVGGVPDGLDWIGVDQYEPISSTDNVFDAREALQLLEPRISTRQRMFLVPQSHANSTTNPVTDTEMASLNHDYRDLADEFNDGYAASAPGWRSVVGMFVFGRFKPNVAAIPVTIGEQYCLGLEAMDAQTIAFHDSYDDANNATADYGLNQSTAARQCKSAWTTTGTSYVRRSGVWNTSTVPGASYNQVNHASQPDRMAFFVGPSAVMVNTALTPGADGIRVSADLSPLTNDDGAGQAAIDGWLTLMLSSSSANNGWIQDGGIDVAVQVRSSGLVQIVSRGTTLTSATAARTATYHVDVTVDGDDVVARVNGVELRASIGTAAASPYYLYESSYWPTGTTGAASTVDNLMVSTRKT